MNNLWLLEGYWILAVFARYFLMYAIWGPIIKKLYNKLMGKDQKKVVKKVENEWSEETYSKTNNQYYFMED